MTAKTNKGGERSLPKRTVWTKKKLARLAALFPKEPWEKILKAFPGLSRGAIRQRAKESGIKRPRDYSAAPKLVWTEKEAAKLANLYPTATWAEILVAFPGKRRSTIAQEALRQGLKRPTNVSKVAGKAPPTPEQIREEVAKFLARARTEKEIRFKHGEAGVVALGELEQKPPAGFRFRKSKNAYQEPTSYLERVLAWKPVKVKTRVFTIRHSENDPDYLSVIFPKELDFSKDPRNSALRIFPIDESRWGDHLCDREKLLEYLRYLEVKPYAFAFLNGNNIGGSHYTKLTAQETREDFLRHLAPVAHKILWAQSGPLEARMMRVDNIEPLHEICVQLGIHHTDRPITADIYWKNPMRPVEFYAIHGRSGARKDGAKVNAILDVTYAQNFPHFTVMGNLREGNVNTLTVRRLDPVGHTVKEHPATTILCPGFQRYEGSNQEKKGYPPPAKGTTVCIIRSDNTYEASS